MLYINTLDAGGFGSSWIAPNYPLPTGARWEGLCFHTDETGPENTIEQAIRTLKWQATAGNTSGGSYHFYVGRQPNGQWAAVRGIRANRAAGGITTNRSASVWAPHRYPELAQYLSPQAYANPNGYLMHVVITGRTALLGAALPSGLARALAELVLDFEQGKLTPSSGVGSLGLGRWGAFLNNHYQWQLNRSDPGKLLLPAVFAEYERLVNPPAPTPPPPPPPPPTTDWKVIADKRATVIESKNASLLAIENEARKGRAISE